MATPRRWDLAADELERVASARAGSLGGREALRLLMRNPRLGLELARIVSETVRTGVFGNNSLTSLLGAERARLAVPDAATGVGWFDEAPFLNALTPWLGKTGVVLELGCGAGRISRHVAPSVRELVCTDASPMMAAEARQNLSHARNVRVQITDGYALPEFGDRSFDVVFGQGVLGYLAPNHLLGLLSEVRRVLRPGGVSVFNFFCMDNADDAAHHLEVVRHEALRRRPHGGIDQAYTRNFVESIHAVVGLDVVGGADEGDSVGGRVVVVGRGAGS